MIALIDGDHIIYLSTYNKKDEEKSWDDVKSYIDSYISDIVTSSKSDSYIGALSFSKSFRKLIFPDYKANRKKLKKPEFFKEAGQYLIEKWNFITKIELEADDIVNIYRWSIGINDCVVISPDKDLLSLEGINYNPRKREFHIIDSETADYKFWTSMLVGDSVDNIKGLEGIGPVGAKKIMQKTQYGDLSSSVVLESYIEKLEEDKGIEEFYKNYKLLKILKFYSGFEFIEPINFNINNELQEKIREKDKTRSN